MLLILIRNGNIQCTANMLIYPHLKMDTALSALTRVQELLKWRVIPTRRQANKARVEWAECVHTSKMKHYGENKSLGNCYTVEVRSSWEKVWKTEKQMEKNIFRDKLWVKFNDMFMKYFTFIILLFWDRISLCYLFCPGTHSVCQAGFELTELTTLPPKYWD